jgi:hypothetical protein
MTSPRLSLWVNDVLVPVESFVQEFMANVITAMLSVMKGADEIQAVRLLIEGDVVDIKVNGTPVPANPFVSSFIKNTVIGMVSSLKGVGEIDRLEISVIGYSSMPAP